MFFELDPISYIFRHVSSQVELRGVMPATNLQVLLTCYIMNAIGSYHNARMMSFGVASVIYILHCSSTLLNLGPLFVTQIRKSYDLNILVAWLKCGHIAFNIVEPIMRNCILVGVLGMNLALICIAFLLIRLNHQLSAGMLVVATIGFLDILIAIKISWEMFAMVHSGTKCCLRGLAKFDVIRKIVTARERKIHFKILKAMKPYEIPIGLENYTFFTAKKSNTLTMAMETVDSTISLLLI